MRGIDHRCQKNCPNVLFIIQPHKKAKGISQDPKATFQQNYDFPHMIVGKYERHARSTGKTHKGKLRVRVPTMGRRLHLPLPIPETSLPGMWLRRSDCEETLRRRSG